jgi:hypothetical protein
MTIMIIWLDNSVFMMHYMHIADQDQKIKILLVVTNDENNNVQEKNNLMITNQC